MAQNGSRGPFRFLAESPCRAVVEQLQSHSSMPTLSYRSWFSHGGVLAVCCALWGCEQDATQKVEGEAGSPPLDASTTTAEVSSCSPVLASDYDQSCLVDSDCVVVGEMPQCPPMPCYECPTAAVNKSVATRYEAALSLAFGGDAAGPACSCACESGAICRAGKCQAALCTPPAADTLAACANAGGQCEYSACAERGPAGSCAYSDEFCCLSRPPGPDAGVCSAPLDTFGCPATYPSELSSACLGPFDSLETASCGPFAAIAHGGPPHWSFCLYRGEDGGTLVGAQSITDVNELCNNTSDTITGGQVPASCSNAIYQQIDPSPDGSTTVLCTGDAGPQDAARE
jgi:hypothetical protein